MIVAPLPANESDRLAALHRYAVLDTPAEPEFDDFTWLASQICGTSIALISLLDADRQWFKSRVGLDALETPRELAFCGHAILGETILEVPNALQDERFHDNPLVVGAPDIRFYAGVPLTTFDGFKLGTLCVIDRTPRQLSEQQRESLARLGRQVVAQMDLRLAHRRLAEQAAFQQAILNSAGSAIIATTAEGIVTHFNPEAERMLGYAADEMIGRLTPGLFHVPAEVAARAAELSRETGREIAPSFEVFVAKARDGQAETREWTYVRRDGSTLPVLLTVTVLRDKSGEVGGYLGIARDISERKRAEAEVRASEVRFRQITENVADLIALLDLEGRRVYNNPMYRRLLDDDHLEVGASSFQQVHPEDRERIRGIFAETLRTGAGQRTDYRLIARDGSVRFIESQGSVIRDASDRVTNVLVVGRDVTERKANEATMRHMQAELERSNQHLQCRNQEIRRFYHTLSHELKTPLTSAREFVSIVLDGLAGPLSPTQSEYLGLAKESCDLLRIYINDLLDVTRMETGKLALQLKPACLGRLADRSVRMLQPEAKRKGIDLQADLAPDLPPVMVDESRIAQVLHNLLGNALKFTPAGGMIRVRTGFAPHRPGFVRVSVSDSGRGIPAEKLEHIFSRLYQVTSGDAATEGGLGLGLYICRELTALHGGTIGVESEPGRGSIFSIDLPAAGRTGDVDPTPPRDAALSRSECIAV